MNDFIRAKKFIESHSWTFARSMARIPHWYCLLSEHHDNERFAWFVRFIRENSRYGNFYGKQYRYFYLNGYKYWDMDPTPESCDLVNRDKYKIDFIDETPYVEPSADIFFDSAVMDVLSGSLNDTSSIADLNCGAGRLLESLPSFGSYSGVDYRKDSLIQFKSRHSQLGNRVWLEKVANLSYENFDLIVSLDAELLDKEDVKRVLKSRKPTSDVFLFSRQQLVPREGLNLVKTDYFNLLTTLAFK